MWEHLIGPGTLKAGIKVVDHLTGGACHGAVEVMEEITSSPAYTKYRVDRLQDTLSDFWDDHEESVGDFFESVGDAVGDGLEAAGDLIGTALGAAAESLGDIIGGLI